jgi:hypothetical protein
MLRAWHNRPVDDFIAQLRTYVIAMDLSPQVVDAVDNLAGANEFEDQYAAELEQAENEAESRGRESMKTEIIGEMTRWLESHSDYDLIVGPCEAMLKEIEKVEA